LNSLIKRSITGFFIVALIISAIALNSITFFLLFLILSTLGILEFYSLVEKSIARPHKYLGTFIHILTFFICYFFSSNFISSQFYIFIILLVPLIFIVELYRNLDQPFNNIAFTLIGLIYITLPFSLLNFFVYRISSEDKYQPHILLAFFFFMWINDSGAYLVGSKFGKRRLFKRISPKKSWEGSLGGAFFTLLSAWIISFFYKDIILIHWISISILVVIFGTFGDLSESLFKRSINIKDSGNILPGHGGILDRFDSLLLASPAVFIYLYLII
jgi:phosphatidate cytidylyltransferase